ncbi:hypothetical protein AAFF_G00047700 [Aldrovandia affinis]|uniref:Uncharacterized protein n=1 Tax=Aldrovandia affinis TaxID=143900 RepID=A0AAD7WEZ9_9TELE|nr:hypothetical protein AAFF_G00047700 [Aldrovandia affinis]
MNHVFPLTRRDGALLQRAHGNRAGSACVLGSAPQKPGVAELSLSARALFLLCSPTTPALCNLPAFSRSLWARSSGRRFLRTPAVRPRRCGGGVAEGRYDGPVEPCRHVTGKISAVRAKPGVRLSLPEAPSFHSFCIAGRANPPIAAGFVSLRLRAYWQPK